MLKKIIAETLLNTATPVDALQGLTEGFARGRIVNPESYIGFTKIAVALLGEDEVLQIFKDNCKRYNIREIQVLEKIAEDKSVGRQNVLNYLHDPRREGFYKLLKFARSPLTMHILSIREKLKKEANINGLVNQARGNMLQQGQMPPGMAGTNAVPPGGGNLPLQSQILQPSPQMAPPGIGPGQEEVRMPSAPPAPPPMPPQPQIPQPQTFQPGMYQ